MIYKNAAELFADMAHSTIGQKRKYTEDPYIVHPRNVAYLVKLVGGTEDMIEAAFLHDVLEDVAPKEPRFGEDAILKRFGKDVLELVRWVTDIPRTGNREERKKLDREHIKDAPPAAKTIKLADLIDNSLTIVEHDIEFAKIYLKEKRLLLDYLLDGNPFLWAIADNILIKHGY